MPQDKRENIEKIVKPSDNDLTEGNPGRNWTPPAQKPSQAGSGTGGSQQQPSSGGSNTGGTSQNKP